MLEEILSLLFVFEDELVLKFYDFDEVVISFYDVVGKILEEVKMSDIGQN